MKRKPWPILALALFQWFSPLGDWVLSASASHLSFTRYLELVLARDGLGGWLLNSWVPSIVAGFAVYQVKPWSYPVFFAWILYSSYRSYHFSIPVLGTTPQEWLSHSWSAGIWMLSFLTNFVLGGWLLLPAMRRPFLNRSLRWWESSPRFIVSLPARIFPILDGKKGAEVMIKDLSVGGALFELRSNLSVAVGDRLLLGFLAQESSWVFTEVRVAHRSRLRRAFRIGVQFHALSGASKRNLWRLLRSYQLTGVPQLRDQTGFIPDLQYWLRQLQFQIGHRLGSKKGPKIIYRMIPRGKHQKTNRRAA